MIEVIGAMLPFDLGTVHFQIPIIFFGGMWCQNEKASPFHGLVFGWSMDANMVLFNGNWQEAIKRKVTKKSRVLISAKHDIWWENL